MFSSQQQIKMLKRSQLHKSSASKKGGQGNLSYVLARGASFLHDTCLCLTADQAGRRAKRWTEKLNNGKGLNP